jgi:hypothetical protein
MDRHLEAVSLPETQTLETTPRVIEYSKLVESLQLSAARLLHVRGSLEANSFTEVLLQHDENEREEITCKVGAEFDQELVNYVTALLIGGRNRNIVIKAANSDGINGHLPWESPLRTHLATLQENGILCDATVRVERPPTQDELVEALTHDAQAFAA